MTSEVDDIKTNEFLRRRKLRLQQVREQSKTIAKKVRQRTSEEKIRQISNSNSQKERNYMKVQDKFVKELQEYYTQGVKNIGDGHKQASTLKETGNEQVDLSKSRGKAAVAELRKRKQDKLDEQKRVLDRKLQARDVANEISREKSLSISNKLSSKFSSDNQIASNTEPPSIENPTVSDPKESNQHVVNDNQEGIAQSAMEAQENSDKAEHESDPNVPSLPLNYDEDPKHSNNECAVPKSKRLNLFTLSDDMPNSLRGGLVNTSSTYEKVKPALTLVTEYLQARAMRLREPEHIITNKKSENLYDIRETIVRSRSTRAEGVCVLDDELVSGPTWYPEVSCSLCKHERSINTEMCQFSGFSCLGAHNATKFNSIDKNQYLQRMKKQSKPSERYVGKNPSVTVYNHSSRNTRDVPYEEAGCVRRDPVCDEDAFTQAVRLTAAEELQSNQQFKNLHNMRSKVAMSKLNVEKEYKDTMDFLNTMHKSKEPDPVIKNAYKDAAQQQESIATRQRKLEYEFKKMEKEHKKKHTCKRSIRNKSKSLSSAQNALDDDYGDDIQYSWMPIPESDENLAIHTIPTFFKEPKSGNSVKFSKVDGYHEYRSRHKHTPPTKEHSNTRSNRKVIEAVFVEDIDESNLSNETDTGSTRELTPKRVTKEPDNKHDGLSDAERIIIYKIVESRKNKKNKKAITTQVQDLKVNDNNNMTHHGATQTVQDKQNEIHHVPLENLKEGIYKAAADKGVSYGILNYQRVDTEIWSSDGPIPWWSNVSSMSMCRHDAPLEDNKASAQPSQPDTRNKCKHDPLQWEIGHKPIQQKKPTELCNCGKSSTCTDGSSFKTADEVDCKKTSNGFIKLIDKDGQEAGQFYIGASGTLKDDAYEVVFQLRKKDGTTSNDNKTKPAMTQIDNDKPIEDKPEVTSKDLNRNKCKETFLLENSSDNVGSSEQEEEIKSCIARDTQNTSIVDAKNTSGHNLIKTVNKSVQSEPNVQQSSNAEVKSIFTQTSFSSTSERQIGIQMSSSASTSYMSPPEKILPSYIRNKHCERASQNASPFNKYSKFGKTSGTPPNTAATNINHQSPSESEYEKKKTKHRCRKVQRRKDISDRKKQNSTQSSTPSQVVWDKLILRLTSDTSSQTKNIAKKNSKPNINPLIKTYIDHLLSLNRDSLKAIEVVNLECSSVTTPSSSIIDTPRNLAGAPTKPLENKISLEQIKKYIENQLIEKLKQRDNPEKQQQVKPEIHRTNLPSLSKKKQMHKVKSLNISKSILKSIHNNSFTKKNLPKSSSYNQPRNIKSTSQKICSVDNKAPRNQQEKNIKSHDKIEPPFKADDLKQKNNKKSEMPKTKSIETIISSIPIIRSEVNIPTVQQPIAVNKTPVTMVPQKEIPIHTSTQTHQSIENEISYIKIAEDKLKNMEKIADLTEKCTSRLSNLAKVLEEVRRKKCATYPHTNSDIITSSDHSSEYHDKENEALYRNNIQLIDPGCCKSNSDSSDNGIVSEIKSSTVPNFTPLEVNPTPHISRSDSNTGTIDNSCVKVRAKPPPALNNFSKYHVTPHELSTVVEVDSPMSLILKNPSVHTSTEEIAKDKNENDDAGSIKETKVNPDKDVIDSKIPMLDLNQFNKIMLQPFISIQEYAKDVNVVSVDEASNIEDLTIPKEGNIVVATDDVSSLHSDGSLPDVVSELLKRKLIAEPFKFDSESNENATTISSDSLSILKIKSFKDKRKPHPIMHNKENMVDSSDTISMSSNPDLENAFKKLGMGWASSTLKKTKERLALSSSSNTSSSSLSQFKVKNFSQDVPALVTDSISSAANATKKKHSDRSKNAEQQTLISNSMTVKEFLKTELSKKITFTRKPDRTDRTDEFVSLYETKIPEDLKDQAQGTRDTTTDNSQNGNNRARTSTPVQIFKSMIYHSSSNSNTSNGLFSNADDLSSVKGSNSIRNHSTSDKDDLTIPNYSLKMRKSPDNSKSE